MARKYHKIYKMKSIAVDLKEKSYSVVPNFFSANLVQAISLDIEDLLKRKMFRSARVGQDLRPSESIRRDQIFWINPEEKTGPQRDLSNALSDLKDSLNQELYLGLIDFETHYAVYESGGFYKKHSDVFQKDDKRVVSFVIYLNPHWKPSDGGELVLYSDKSQPLARVSPTAGTLVCFLSHIEHEVLISHTTRQSCTGWFRRRKL